MEMIPNISPGFGQLDFETFEGSTIVRTVVAKSPLRLLTPQNQGSAAWVYMSTFGGGLVDGDALKIKINVGADATAVLLSQSATKVYRSEVGSSQILEGQIQKGATLYSIPDPIFCFEGSNFSQVQRYNLEESASLLLVDTLHSGRYGNGERWAFDRFKSHIEVQRNSLPLFNESTVLDPLAGKISARQGRFNSLSTVLFIGKDLEVIGREIMAALSVEKPSPRADLVVTASPLTREGVVLNGRINKRSPPLFRFYSSKTRG